MFSTPIVNIYNFIRMSHMEPSRFLWDDFETLRRELITVKQFGFPGTYALKYDALMEPRYQALLGEYLDENDEIGAWWEISEPLCRRAGVPFRGHQREERYDDRVDSAYAIGYAPAERKRLVDAYMADFHEIFGTYPKTIGAWVLDSVTFQYAVENYGVAGGAICRDQLGTDGFTLWGGWPNGLYYPSVHNEFIPARTPECQIPAPMFRLLGPDPIYNFEAQAREGLQGVYTLEPSWLIGRDPKWIRWFFTNLTEEDALGIGYAQVGQENNFLWENIQPGLAPQLAVLAELAGKGAIRVEPMGATARWFREQYRLTPPMSFQASRDWDESRNLSAQWYACANYRLGLLWEEGHLRIRDLFLYDETYPSRYLSGPMQGTKSLFDALPVLSPQLMGLSPRPFLRLRSPDGAELSGNVAYTALSENTAQAILTGEAGEFRLTMTPQGLTVTGGAALDFDRLPGAKILENRVEMAHNGFPYGFFVTKGVLTQTGEGLTVLPEEGQVSLSLGPALPRSRREDTVPIPQISGTVRPVPPAAPQAEPEDAVFPAGTTHTVTLSTLTPGEIRYTLDGSQVTGESPVYTRPIDLSQDTLLRTRLFSGGEPGEEARYTYRFANKKISLTSPTGFDPRPVFRGGGISALLRERQGNLDYLCGRYLGTLEDLDVTGVLETPGEVEEISIGFLSHHRSGIVLPAWVALYIGDDPANLTLLERRVLPNGPGEREIFRYEASFPVGRPIGAFRLLCHRHEKMPPWCCYHGDPNVFTMADCLIVK